MVGVEDEHLTVTLLFSDTEELLDGGLRVGAVDPLGVGSPGESGRCWHAGHGLAGAEECFGETEFRRQVMAAVEPFKAADGSYRLVNELTDVVAHKPG
ncbi:MAG: hypothetical protein V3V01_16250 [Acidimicrobiales bacterium]